ncbi:MAG: adenylate/guanylate cyclase domain-containing protein [Actinomycetota bacterium]
MPDVRFAPSGRADIAYHVVGDGEVPLVWAQGAFTHLEANWAFPPFRRFCEALADFTRLILFDKRGMGMSSRGEGSATLEVRMDDIGAVLDAEGIHRAALMGESEGGPLSLLFAAAHPERVTHLVLQGAEVRERRDRDWPYGEATDADLEAYCAALPLRWGRVLSGTSVLFGDGLGEPDWVREAILGMQRHACSPREWEAFARMAFEIDVREMVSSVRVPTLVLHADGDRVCDVENARFLAARIPGAELVERSGSDHVPWFDPDRVVPDIRRFLVGEQRSAAPDRVLATVLFTDVVGSTPLAAELGDEHWRSLLEVHYRLARTEIQHHRGTSVVSTGDGFVARFDGPARAIRCANAIIAGAARDGLQIRAGVHTGEVELIGDEIAGLGVHIGARIGAIAAAGEILVSGSVRDIVAGSGLRFSDRGDHELRGVPGTWRVFAVDRTSTG